MYQTLTLQSRYYIKFIYLDKPCCKLLTEFTRTRITCSTDREDEVSEIFIRELKVDGTSFSDAGSLVTTVHLTREICPQDLRWPNTVFARALADAIQRAHKPCKNKNAVDTVIILFAQCPLYLCYFSS